MNEIEILCIINASYIVKGIAYMMITFTKLIRLKIQFNLRQFF